MSRAAFLSARNDVLVNVSIIAMGLITAWTDSGWTDSGWPDLILGCLIILIALHAAYEVWEVSEEERLAAKALAGDENRLTTQAGRTARWRPIGATRYVKNVEGPGLATAGDWVPRTHPTLGGLGA